MQKLYAFTTMATVDIWQKIAKIAISKNIPTKTLYTLFRSIPTTKLDRMQHLEIDVTIATALY